MALTQIKTTGIADDAVTTDKLANAINTERTANTAKVSLENDSVTGAKIADDAVGAEHIEVLDAALQFGDNVKVQFGAGNDLEIYHHGSWGSSYINNSGSGAFFIESDDIRFRKADNSELYFQAVANGAVELYYDNSKKLETTSAGAKVTGDLFFNDSHAIKLGTGQDLWLYNDGTNSYVNNVAGGGHLILQGNGDAGKVVAINPKHGENGLVANADGAVELYYDNVKTFETADNGIKVVASENNHARIHMWADDGDDGPDKWEILATTQGQLRFYHGASFENTIVLNGDGAVELYYDNVKKLETLSDGVLITGQCRTTNNFSVYDNVKYTAGSSADLQIYHDGSTSRIHSASDSLYLRTGNIFAVYNGAGNEEIIRGIQNGAVELYYDNSKKLETTSAGVIITGNAVASSKFRGNDNVKLSLGDAEDLQLYHNGTHSYITNQTGNFHIESNTCVLRSASQETYFLGSVNGASKLYYDDALKFATSADGTTTTGNASFAGAVYPSANASYNLGYSSQRWNDIYMKNDMFINDDGRICWGDGNDLQIYHDGSNTYLDNAIGDVYLRQNGSENSAKFIKNGAVELYYNDSKKFETQSWGVAISGELTTTNHVNIPNDTGKFMVGASNDLQIYHDGSHSRIDEVGTGDLKLQSNNAVWIQKGASESIAGFVADGACELYYDNSKKLETAASGVTVAGNNDLRFSSGTWTGESCKIQNHSNYLYIQGGSNGIRFRRINGTDSWYIDSNGNLWPAINNQYSIGTSNNRVANLYVNDLQLSNFAKKDTGGNDVDGTWGDWTLQEGEEDIFMINNRSGKKYKMALQEVN